LVPPVNGTPKGTWRVTIETEKKEMGYTCREKIKGNMEGNYRDREERNGYHL
jgi:hypothetical protein